MCKANACHLCDEGRYGFWKRLLRGAWRRRHCPVWQEMDRKGRCLEGKFVYESPHLRRSPCVGCRCAGWCDKPCRLRLWWWDTCVGGNR